MIHLDGFAPLAARYDGFIVDLWGVVHDGVAPYAGAADALARLRRQGARVALLSNAPRRAAAVEAALHAMGLAPGSWTAVVTSGEAAHAALAVRPDPWFRALGEQVFHLGPERDRGVMEGLGLQQVADPAAASFVLNTGPDDLGDPGSVAEFEPVLRACRAASLPMLCANPDLEVIRGGRRIICAGALANRYAKLGGDVRQLGKPDPAIYGSVLDILGVSPDRVLAVGDSLRTDIAGAAAAGLDACWVLGGIHGEALGDEIAAVEALAGAAGLAPVAAIPTFRW